MVKPSAQKEADISCLILIVVLPCIFDKFKDFWQQMHSLLKHKMLQLTEYLFI
jgi:hypothetical protein